MMTATTYWRPQQNHSCMLYVSFLIAAPLSFIGDCGVQYLVVSLHIPDAPEYARCEARMQTRVLQSADSYDTAPRSDAGALQPIR